MKNLLTITAILFLGLICQSQRVSADVVAEYNLNVNINSDLSSQMNLTVDLHNTSDTSLVSGYSIDLPYQVTAADATLNSNAVSVILDSKPNSSNIKIDFLTNVIKPGSNASLNLTVFSLNSIKEVFKMKEFTLPYPSSNYNYSAINVSIVYPVTLGSISYASEFKYDLQRVDDNFTKITFQQTGPIQFLWGAPEFNAVFNSTITNRKDSDNHFLYSLIPEYSDQIVNYTQIFASDYALVDKLNNTFAFLTVSANESIELNSQANIKLNSSKNIIEHADNYGWNIDLDSVLGQQIYSNINQGTETLSKFKSVNDFIITSFSLNADKIDLQSLSSIWQSNNKDINSLQYCYLIVSTAEYLGYKGKIEYGYALPVSSQSVNPSIWCSVQVDGRTLVFDFESQKINGHPQIVTSTINKLRMGIWHPDQSYNTILGLVSEEPTVATITDSNSYIPDSQLELQLKTEFPSNVYSGEFYSGKIIIVNPTSNIAHFNDLKINNESVLSNIAVGQLYKAAMPLQQTSINIDYLRETDFILNLSRDITVEVNIEDKVLSNSTTVRFEPDFKLIILFIVILIITVSIFVYLIVKLIRRKV